MNEPKQPNGWDLAVDGMNTAASHADRVVPDWSKEALTHFKMYLLHFGHQPFMTEDVRTYAENMGMEPPPDRRAWGAIAVQAKKLGWVRSLGYAPQKSTNAHRAPKNLWERVV